MRQIVRVGIADREQPFRAGVRAALEHAGHRLVAEAGSVEPLAALCADQVLDLVLIQDVLVTGGEIAARFPHVAVVARRPTLDGMVAALNAGAVGYIERETSAAGLIAAVEDAARGIPVAPSMLASVLLEQWRPRRPDTPTRRQRQVQMLSEQGCSTQEIADALGLSPITVRRHRSSLADRTRPAPAERVALGRQRGDPLRHGPPRQCLGDARRCGEW